MYSTVEVHIAQEPPSTVNKIRREQETRGKKELKTRSTPLKGKDVALRIANFIGSGIIQLFIIAADDPLR